MLIRHALPAVLAPLLLLAPAVPTSGAPSTAPRPRPVPCDKPSEDPGGTSQLHELIVGGLERSYVLRLPDGYEKRDDWPLIVAFHGRGSTGVEVEGYSELSRLPAVVAYPDGAIGTGDGYRQAWQGAPYQPPGVDDVAFSAALLDDVQTTHCVDRSRTYATGKSNGGGLTALLACRLPDRFAAVAPVAAAYYPQARAGCDGAPPVPVIAVHGTGDTTIPYAGDPDRDLPAVRDQVATWAARNGCRTERRPERRGEVTAYRFTDCRDHADVEHVAVTGGGHVWPGSDIYSGGGYTTRQIETSQVIWRFFSRHDLADRTGSTERTDR